MKQLSDYAQAIKKIHTRHTVSFAHAFDGLFYCLKTQPNFLVHLSLSISAVIAGVALNISPTEWVLLILTISVGLVIEIINSAIEATVDLITQEWKINAKIAKDTAAAAMLLYAFGAVLIAIIIFLPKIQL